MQILYANDGINYRTISKSPSLSSEAEKVLLGSYVRYSFVSNPHLYSSVSQEPEAFSYAVSDLNKGLKSDCMIVSKTGHMSTYSTPSYYFHALIEKVDDDYFKEQFFEIFNYDFVSDREVSKYEQMGIDNYQFRHEPMIRSVLKPEQLIAVLASFMNNEKKLKKTKIIVDVSGDGYNRRSREILASIYKYLPYELRKKHGFLSYSKDAGGSGRVSFVLYPREELNNINNDFIDLKAINLQDLQNRIDRQYLSYAQYLVIGLEDEGRKQHFETLSKIARNGKLKIDDCVTYYLNLNKWMNGTQERLLPEWISYVDQNSFRKGPLYELMVNIIKEKIDNNYYNTYLFKNTLELYQEKIHSISPKAAKVIRFADCIEGLQIDPRMFKKWYISQSDLFSRYEDDPSSLQKLKRNLTAEIKFLREIENGSAQFKKLSADIADELESKLKSIDKDLSVEEDKEAERMGKEFVSLSNVSIETFERAIGTIRNRIVFDNSTEIYAANVEEWMKNYLNTQKMNEAELRKFGRLLNNIKSIIPSSSYQEIGGQVSYLLKKIEEEKKSKLFNISQTTILDNFKNLQIDKANGLLNPSDQVTVFIGTQQTMMSVANLEVLMEFVLVSQKYEAVVKTYLDQLMMNNLLKEEHCLSLIKNADGYEVKKIVDYYLKAKTIRISGFYLANVVKNYAEAQVKYLVDVYKDIERYEVREFVKELTRSRRAGQENQRVEKKDKRKGLGFFKK